MKWHVPAMQFVHYKALIASIPFGKVLPNAKYVLKTPGISFGDEVDALLSRVSTAFELSEDFNVLKFRTDEFKISFLAYPSFHEDPHPALEEAVTIDLARNKCRRQSYQNNANPPILHRKEHFLPKTHESYDRFAALTHEEEQAGLYEHPSKIGFRLNWEKELRRKGVGFRGYRLIRIAAEESKEATPIRRTVDRHKTAMTRYDLSKPVKSLLEYGLLKPGAQFFDYGCGQGSDVTGLRSLGYDVHGWDPVFAPNGGKIEADIVNLGFVVNVIEDPIERVETLLDAFHHTRDLLVVSALVHETVDTSQATRYRDGVLTKRNTFQKFYDQSELQHYIEDALEMTAIPVALGIFYVFRKPQDQQDFLQARTKRQIDWSQISSRLGLGRPGPRARKERPGLYQLHADILDPFWQKLLELGRQPTPEEFPQLPELKKRLRSANRAERLFVENGGEAELTAARERRKNELLVYLAISNFRKRVPFKHLSPALRKDIKFFIGDYKRGLEEGMDLLFAAGDPDEIEIACEAVAVGHQDNQALYVHCRQLDELPPILRIYVACASQLYGDIKDADIIKLHKASGKVTFLIYDDFDRKKLPELQQRIKVDLRRQFVNVFDHSRDGQLLYQKASFMTEDDPEFIKQTRFSEKLKSLGIGTSDLGPSKAEFQALLEQHGLNENLNKRRKVRASSET